MNFSIRKIINDIYNESQDFKKRKFDIGKYRTYIEQANPEEMMVIAFKEFPGNFARKFVLYTLKWWKCFDKTLFINVLNKIYDDELALVYFVSFAKRYFDLDLTNFCNDKDLYLKPITYFEHSSEWILELQRMNIDIPYLKNLKNILT